MRKILDDCAHIQSSSEVFFGGGTQGITWQYFSGTAMEVLGHAGTAATKKWTDLVTWIFADVDAH